MTMLKSTISNTFAESLSSLTSEYAEAQATADKLKWKIAKLVNEYYDECNNFHADKMAYYVECTRIANDGFAVNIFGESGQTLRRWCEVQAPYQNMPQAETFLDELSFAHLEKAKKLVKDGKVLAPDYALAKAVDEGWSCDDMAEYFDPSEPPDPYKQFKNVMSSLLDPFTYSWISDPETISKLIRKAREYEEIKNDYLKKKGLAE